MASLVDGARRDWEDGHRRFREAERDGRQLAERLHQQLSVVTDELRRRVGGTFSLEELAAVYAGSEPWLGAAVAERAPGPGWPATLAIVGDAAFHLYSRGAIDYKP